VVVSGRTALALQPGKVPRPRLDANLRLDHCTLAAEHSFVAMGPWLGSVPGPDRPWLVTTSECAFFGHYERAAPASVLLRSDPEALAHGAVFWQSQGDALEVPCFVLTGDGPPPAGRRPDVRTQWVAFWGERHTGNGSVTGPRAPTGQPSHRTLGKLRPGDVEPGDLAIDPDYPAGHRPTAVGVDFARLGITPTPRGGRRR
jgi:serine/threonine-protein kinase